MKNQSEAMKKSTIGLCRPSGELQPGLLCEQALRAVCNFFRLLKHIDISSTANDRCCKQPGGPVHVIAQAEAPRRGKRSLGKRQPTHTAPEGRHKLIIDFFTASPWLICILTRFPHLRFHSQARETWVWATKGEKKE